MRKEKVYDGIRAGKEVGMGTPGPEVGSGVGVGAEDIVEVGGMRCVWKRRGGGLVRLVCGCAWGVS